MRTVAIARRLPVAAIAFAALVAFDAMPDHLDAEDAAQELGLSSLGFDA